MKKTKKAFKKFEPKKPEVKLSKLEAEVSKFNSDFVKYCKTKKGGDK
jgi:hypothetical protein